MSLSEKIQAAYATAKNYPDLATKLLAAGVLSYTVDTSSGLIIYRVDGGLIHLGGHASEPLSIARNFDEALTIKAIRDNQQGKTTYPEFMQGIADAGVRFYEASLKTEKPNVTYIGIGGSYEEDIPMGK
jgi:uncharacterized protein YbcV (DUF1398 family)